MKKYKWLLVCLVAIVICSVFVACSQDIATEDIELKATGLKNDTLTLYKGAELKIAATLKPSDASDSISWSVENTVIASVTDGVVKGLSAGSTKLHVKAGKIEKVINIVVEEYVPISSITFPNAELEIDTGVRKQLEFSVSPSNATINTLVFEVSPANEGVKVSSAGIIEVSKDVEGGKEFVVIARGYNEQNVTATLKVIARKYELEDILLVDSDFYTEIKSITVPLDEPYRVLFQMAVPEKAIPTGEAIATTWTSSNEDVCTVNEKGRLKFHSMGDATITMEAMNITKTVNVTVVESSGNFIENYYIPQSYINAVGTFTPSSDNGWQTFADFRNGGTGAADAKNFVLQKYKYHTGPGSWFAGGGYCIEMGGWDNIHSGLEDDDFEGGGLANLFMWTKVALNEKSRSLRTYFQYRETDATFKYKLRHTIIDLETKEVVHLSDWKTGEFNSDPNLAAGESYIESEIPEKYRGKTVIIMLEYDDIDYTTDGIINGVESVNIKYFSLLNFDGTSIDNALWVIGDSIMTTDFTGSMVSDIAQKSGYTLFRDTISGSTIAPASSIGIVDHIDSGLYEMNFAPFGTPKVIVIQRGTNDVYWSEQDGNPLKLGDPSSTDKTTTYGAIKYILNYFTRTYPDAKIVWSTAFYRTDAKDSRIRDFNQNLKNICADYSNVEIFDLYELTGFNESNSVQYLTDGIHPSNSGKAVLLELWTEKLKAMK